MIELEIKAIIVVGCHLERMVTGLSGRFLEVVIQE